jgi:predicted DCC family thiol-disulfide oxidoreductase YuxK/gamma-glutamylcyclotransferase (GGCT)/AIG2-like uncharacterized protein YtfP
MIEADAKQIAVFDGECNLCARSVSFILDHERDNALHFAAAQSMAGRELLHRFGLDAGQLETFVFIDGDRALVRSDAALAVARHLRLPWRLLTICRIIPRACRDWIYRAVARNRYRWFGRRESCRVATPQQRSRFIEDQYLFVYGTLRHDAGHRMHDLLAQHAILLGEATFRGRLYSVGSYPGVVSSDNSTDGVKGEVYYLREWNLLLSHLDRYEGCGPEFPAPTEYVRQQHEVTLTSGQSLMAWIYIYNCPTDQLPRILSGDFLNA